MVYKKLWLFLPLLLTINGYAEQRNEPIQSFHYVFAPGLVLSKTMGQMQYAAFIARNILLSNDANINPTAHISGTSMVYFNDLEQFRAALLGQEHDIQSVYTTLKEVIAQHPNDKIIAVGSSRGAGTWINTIGWLAQHDQDILRKIAGVVLEAPFADTAHVALSTAKKIVPFWMPYRNDLEKKVADTGISLVFPDHDPKGIQPIKSIQTTWQNVDSKIPILFIHATNDDFVSIEHSRIMVKELTRHGFTNVHFGQIPYGGHCLIPWLAGSLEQNILQSFYQNNQLPHTTIEEVINLQDLLRMPGENERTRTLAHQLGLMPSPTVRYFAKHAKRLLVKQLNPIEKIKEITLGGSTINNMQKDVALLQKGSVPRFTWLLSPHIQKDIARYNLSN